MMALMLAGFLVVVGAANRGADAPTAAGKTSAALIKLGARVETDDQQPAKPLPQASVLQELARQPDKSVKSDFAAVRDLIHRRMVSETIPSVAVAVARDGQFLWEEGFGWADREKRLPATEHTMYSLASISKPITATGLMVLQQRGKVDLDRPINDYLGEAKLRAWVGDAREATVRRVANHTSGLPLHYQFFYEDEPYRRPAMDETIRRYGILVRPPGEQYYYSNLGYGILDYVIARQSGKRYGDFMREEVFLPLGMTRASVDIGPGLEPFAATRYGPDGLAIPFYDFDHPGASAVFCSAHDLVRFGLFHAKCHLPDQKAILSDSTLDAMHEASPQGQSPGNYGIGWALDKFQGCRRIGHSGGMGGVSTILTILPDEKLAVAVLCNCGTTLPQAVEQQILSVLMPESAQKPSPPSEQKPAEPRPAEQTKAEQKLASGKLSGEWRGTVHTYKGDLPLTLWFKDSGDIHVRLGNQLKTLLNNVGRGDDRLSGVMMGDIGTEDANRTAYELRLNLKLREDRLTGTLIAITRSGKRVGNALSHWVELKKPPD
jgi:CubicO group peptidase (beta-lactamase class C family)